ncbi:hypothetical protein CCR95_06810 [Thiocystis minor]|uniref:IS1595 family transposase n=1 Tax=Thiocystis minor TaxID=61597 RepID=UPI001914BA2E|nr:hypothetical protein [Thiocystis minor]
MAINRIQLQPGLSLTTFLEQYGTEAPCEAALERWRWPEGFVCPRCEGRVASRFQRGYLTLWQCHGCGHQTSLIAGTVFESTHLPLTTWFQATFHLTQAKNGVSALELKRLLGVNYKAAWRLKHKLMQVMDERESDRILHGRVEVDDAYLGGVRAGQRGRGAEGKVPFVIAVETDPNDPVSCAWTHCRIQQGRVAGMGSTGSHAECATGLRWIGVLRQCRRVGGGT